MPAPDDILYGALRMRQPAEGEGPRVNVDTVLLASFIRAKRSDRVLELGCAHGAISLLLAKKRVIEDNSHPCEKIIGVDIQSHLIEMARANAVDNGLDGLVDFSVADLRECRRYFPAQSFDVVAMNPPYDEEGRSRRSNSHAIATAKHGDECTLADVVDAARYLIANGGRLYLVIRAKRVGELFSLLDSANVRPKILRTVHPKPDRSASVALVEAVRASGHGLFIAPPLYIYGSDGEYTDDLLSAYRLD